MKMMWNKHAGLVLFVLILTSVFVSMTPQQVYAEDPSFDKIIEISGEYPSYMVATGGNIYVTWMQNKILPDGGVISTDVFFRTIKDDGSNLGSVINLPNGDRRIESAQFVISGNYVYAVWRATLPDPYTTPKWEIFFTRSTDSGASFSNPIRLGGDEGTYGLQIAVSGNNVYVLWAEGEVGKANILFRKSTDNGATFDQVVNIGRGWSPKLDVSEKYVYVIWDSGDIFFTRSTDNGRSFELPVNLSNDKGFSGHSQIAVFGKNVYVVWADDVVWSPNTPGKRDILFVRSIDSGASFDPVVNLSKSGDAEFPKISVSGKYVYVEWFKESNAGPKLLTVSKNSGATFGSVINLTNKFGVSISKIGYYGSNVYVVWINSGDAYFSVSRDNGNTFEGVINLSKEKSATIPPNIIVSDNKIYVIWGKEGHVLFRVGTILTPSSEIINDTNNIFSFANSINLSNDDAGIAYHEIAANGSYVYVVWAGAAVSGSGQFIGNADIFFRASKDNGITFNNVINVSKNSGNSILPKIAASGNNVYVVWQDDGQGGREIFFAKSTDNGVTFSNPRNLSDDSKDSVFPQMAVSGNNVYVVWQDGMSSGIPDVPLPNADILFRASTDNGVTFGSTINLSKNDGYSQAPQIAVSGNNVYIVWYDTTPGNFDVFLARSTNKGASFNAINISKSSGFSTHPRIAVSGSNVYVIWFDDTNQGGLGANADIFFARSTDNGASFSDAVTLWSNNRKSNAGAQIAAQDNNVYVVWSEGETNYSRTFDVFFVRSIDNGASFDNPVNLSNNAWSSDNPVIAVSGSSVYIAWQDNTPGNGDPSKNWDAFLRVSKDNGASFSNIINVSNNEGPSFAPNIALSGDNVYVAWMDKSFGNGDVLFTVGSVGRQSTKQIPTSLEPIAINSISNSKPRWSLDEVTISGTVSKPSSLNAITIDWGDDTISNVRIIQQNGSWGPVGHTYDVEYVGKKQIVAKLFSGRVLKASSTPYEIEVRKHATSIIIDQIPNVEPSSPITVRGSLFDEDANVGISGRIITFNGTGASDLERTVTFKGGTFSSKGTATTKASAGLTVQAHFAGDSVYLVSSSNVVIYNVGKSVEEEPKASGKPKEKVVGEPKEKIETSDAINVQMKQKKELILISVKNNNAEDVFEVKIKTLDGSIKFVKARGWERERVDQSTVIVSTDDEPITSERSLIIMLIADNISSLEWFAVNESGVEISRGIIRNE